MLRRTLLSTLLAGSASLAYWSAPARAQDAAAAYPDKPVTIIVPFAAGGNTDAFARLVGQELDTALGQRFVVENKAGAGGNIGVGQLARSEPDGYTLGMGTVSTHAINPTLYKNLPYDPDTAFAPISLFVTLPNVLAVNPKIEAKSVPELIELVKAKPDTYTFASSGVGTSIHLAGEMLMARTGIKMNHVPYKSSGQVMTDVVAGHVDMAFDNIPTVAQQAKRRQCARAGGDQPGAGAADARRPAHGRLSCPASRRPRGTACSRPPGRRPRSSTRSASRCSGS